MPSILAYRPIRLLCDLSNPNLVLEQRTGLPPVIVRGSPTVFQIALALDRLVCDGVAALAESISIEVRASADPTEEPLMSKSITSVAINDALTQSEWAAKTAQHAAFEFTAAECNIEAGEKWLTVWFVKENGDAVPCAFGKIKVTEDGAGDPGDPDVLDSDYYTRAEADARYARQAITDGAFRVSADGKFIQLKDSGDGLWRSIWFANGVLQMAAGEA
jgi:hypothetical protein